METTTENIGKLIIRTAKIREDSYIKGGIRCHYKLTIEQAAAKATMQLKIDPRLAELVNIALLGWWNDAIAWAKNL